MNKSPKPNAKRGDIVRVVKTTARPRMIAEYPRAMYERMKKALNADHWMEEGELNAREAKKAAPKAEPDNQGELNLDKSKSGPPAEEQKDKESSSETKNHKP